MKHSLVFTVAILAAISTAVPQEIYRMPEGDDPTHLTPPSVEHSGELEYMVLLQEKLLSRWGRGQCGTMLAMPAFTGEYCVSIYEETKGGEDAAAAKDESKEYIATSAKASGNLFFGLESKKRGEPVREIEITHTERKISPELAVAFQRVWARAILQTRYPQAEPPQTSDGISYRFSVLVEIGDISGEAHNPEKGIGKEMAEIGHKLYDYVSGEETMGKKEEDELIARLRDLEKKLP